jgi:hypothetical protein
MMVAIIEVLSVISTPVMAQNITRGNMTGKISGVEDNIGEKERTSFSGDENKENIYTQKIPSGKVIEYDVEP